MFWVHVGRHVRFICLELGGFVRGAVSDWIYGAVCTCVCVFMFVFLLVCVSVFV